MRFEHLTFPPQWKDYWTKYPHGMTILESLIDWVTKTNDLIDNVNGWNTYLDDFVSTFDENLKQEVTETVQSWIDSGYIEVVISEALQTQIDDVELQLNNEVERIDSQLADIAINAFHVGVIPNDDTKATQNTIILNDLLSDPSKPIYLPGGVISVDNTLLFSVDSYLYGADNTFIKPLADVDVVSLKTRSQLENIRFSIPSTFTKSVILLDGTNAINGARIKNVRANLYNETTTGIKLIAVGKGKSVTFCTFDNVHIGGGLHAIYMEDNQSDLADQGYVNGNRFTNMTLYGKYGIYIKGQCAGNQFDFQYQSVANMVSGIYCEGNNNTFNGFAFDAANRGGKNFILTSESFQNTINLPQINTGNRYSVNEGVNNIISNKAEEISTLTTEVIRDLVGDVPRIRKSNFFGPQDNCLAYVDKNAVVTITGDRIDAGNNSIPFDPRSLNTAVFSDPSITPIVIEIDMTLKPITSLYMVGINFSGGLLADSYKIEIAPSNDGVYTDIYNVTNNRLGSIVQNVSMSGKVYKLKITITKAAYHDTVNPNKQISIKTIYGASAVHYASPFLYTAGDTMSGHLSFGSQAFGIRMISPNGTTYLLRINDDGTLRVDS